MNDWEPSTTTSAGNAGGTTLIDTYLKKYQSNRLEGRYVRVTQAGTNQYAIRTIESNASATGTVTATTAFPAQIGNTSTYEIHRYDPAKKFTALDQARFDVSDFAYRLIYDETITADGQSMVFPIPSSIRMGPSLIYEESPVASQNIIWNFITNPIGDSVTPWTQTNCTASVTDINYTDLVIPKYDYAATKIQVAASTVASYTQPVAEMSNSITASLAAGRKMTLGMWVYCEDASRIRMLFTDDSGTTYSSYHQGLGWELLTVEKDVVGNNATTLTVGLAIASGTALTLHWNRSWLYFGSKERITECYTNEAIHSVRSDDTTKTFMLQRVPERGHQLRCIGQEVLSALGTTPATQVTNTMEVDEDTALMLYARAAELILEWEGMVASDVPDVYQRIALVRQRLARVDKFRIDPPFRRVASPYMV